MPLSPVLKRSAAGAGDSEGDAHVANVMGCSAAPGLQKRCHHRRGFRAGSVSARRFPAFEARPQFDEFGPQHILVVDQIVLPTNLFEQVADDGVRLDGDIARRGFGASTGRGEKHPAVLLEPLEQFNDRVARDDVEAFEIGDRFADQDGDFADPTRELEHGLAVGYPTRRKGLRRRRDHRHRPCVDGRAERTARSAMRSLHTRRSATNSSVME